MIKLYIITKIPSLRNLTFLHWKSLKHMKDCKQTNQIKQCRSKKQPSLVYWLQLKFQDNVYRNTEPGSSELY